MKRFGISIILLIIWGVQTVQAQGIRFVPDEFLEINTAAAIKAVPGGYNNPLKRTAHEKWEDMKANPTTWRSKYKFKQLTNYVKVAIDHSNASNTIAAYRYQINIQVRAYKNPADTTAYEVKNVVMEIAYNKDSLAAYTDQHIVKLDGAGYHMLKPYIMDVIDLNASTPVTVAKASLATNFYIETGIITQRIDLTARTLYAGSQYDAAKQELTVNWSHTAPASGSCVIPVNTFKTCSYEIEWLYVDDYKLNSYATGAGGYKFTASAYSIPYDFRNNATRVVTDKSEYRIPVVYEHGAILFRVRGVYADTADYSRVQYGAWTLPDNGTLTPSSSSCMANRLYLNLTPHQSDSLNWQYSINFAEEGKYKHVLSYFDGAGKSRQTLTRIQTDNNYIIGMDNVYDYEGRAAIKTLPTPIPGSNLKFQKNISLNATTAKPYKATDFDNGCLSDSIAPLHSTALSNIYYSSSNPDKTYMQKFVPSAEGYPFIETIYAPDNTNKVLWQGGAGRDFQRWKNRGTRFVYGRADQDELNRMLGTESGTFEYYPKQVTVDPNGQASYSIYNQKGQVVATALSGSAPDSTLYPVSRLGSYTAPSTITYDLLKNVSQQVDKGMRKAEHNFIAEAAGTNKLKYGVRIPSFSTGCAGKFINIGGKLRIGVVDDCGNVKWSYTANAGTSSLPAASTPQNISLPEGSFALSPDKYTIVKELYFPDTAISRMTDTFVKSNTGLSACFNNLDQFIRREVDSTDFPCATAPEQTECEMARKKMKEELYPGAKYGQYTADGEDHFISGVANSIFTTVMESGGPTCKYTIRYNRCPPPDPDNPATFPCGCGIIDTIVTELPNPLPSGYIEELMENCGSIIGSAYDCYTPSSYYRYQSECLGAIKIWVKYGSVYMLKPLSNVTPEELIANFNDGVAEALLPLHPEYCKLQGCDTGDFKRRLLGIDSYKEAEALDMQTLAKILAKDPMNKAVKPAAPFTATQLSYYQADLALTGANSGLLRRIDTMAMEMAWCGCNTSEPTLYCRDRQYRNQINSMFLPDDYTKDLFISHLKSHYLAIRNLLVQKMMDGTDTACAPCAADRMVLVQPPVFPRFFDAAGNVSAATGMPLWMKNLFNDAADGSLSSGSTVPSALTDSLEAYSERDCKRQVDDIMNSLVNCGMTPAKTASVRLALESAYCSNGNAGADITPDIVQGVLADNLITLNDLCHPFLAKYGLYDYSKKEKNTNGFISKSPQFYQGLQNFLARTQVTTALKTAVAAGTTAVSLTLDPAANPFEKELADALGGSAVSVRGYVTDVFAGTVSGTTTYKKFYKLALINGAVSDTLFFSPRDKENVPIGGSPVYTPGLLPDNNTTAGATTQITFYDVKSVLEERDQYGVIPGVIADHLVFATLDKQESWPSGGGTASSAKYAFYNIWSHKIPMLRPAAAGAPEECITCTELKYALDTFKSEAATHKYVTYPNHPLFGRTLASYLNYKLKKQHTFEEYRQLMEGCAVSDHIVLNMPSAYIRLVYAGTSSFTNAENFVSTLHAAFDSVRFDNFCYKAVSSGSSAVLFDFNSVPFHLLKAAKDYIMANGSSPVLLTLNSANNKVLLFTTIGSPTPIIPGMASTTGNLIYRDPSGAERTIRSINFTQNLMTGVGISDALDSLDRYIRNTPNFVLVKPVYYYQLYRSADYHTTEKQQYLDYAYGLGADAYAARAALAPDSVKAHVSSLSAATLKLQYADPACSAVKDHLYFYNETQAGHAGYDRLKSVINVVRTGLGSGRLFPVNTETTIPSSSLGAAPYTHLKAYKLAGGGAWYRFFDASDRLYNIYLMPSEAMASAPETYETFSTTVSPVLLPGADSIYHFSVQMKKGSHTVTCKGYTDFPVGAGKRLEHVVLYDNKGNEGCPDETCEEVMLEEAVTKAETAHELYIDSIKRSYREAMKAFFPANAVDTLKHTTQKQQYHHTLYYYDLAGNLSRTVPPAGVAYLSSGLETVDANRSDANPANDLTPRPVHGKVSTYRYNSLNQLTWQQTPDGGISRFYYDYAGRIAFSQNAKQQPESRYSYTLYDDQGRIFETGTIAAAPEDTLYISQSSSRQMSGAGGIIDKVRTKIRNEVVGTRYDYQLLNLETEDPGLSAQQNLRKRVGAIMYSPVVNAGEFIENNYTYATHFSYDALGNVAALVHDNPYMDYMGQRFKRVDYEYDLLSGKVNMLSYNRGHTDQYYQRYEYDADNRLLRAFTSRDGLLWDRDAEYDYYKHGPLARVSTGRLNVQQTEYAYTIQGWLKAINGDALNPADEMGYGLDGGLVTRDVMVHSLDYYKGDYRPIGTTQVNHKPVSADLGRSLYNGNIARQTTGMTGMSNLQRDYSYDQLHRIRAAQYSSYDNIAHTVTSLGNAFRNTYTYDADGNIQKLSRRNAAGSLIDSFSYTYLSPAANNRLGHVSDLVSTAAGTPDLKQGQTAGNYAYDPTGNLVYDRQEGITNIDWTAYGKMAGLSKGDATTDTMLLQFAYDGTGQRVRKDYLQPVSGGSNFSRSSDLYVRDAGGNILAVYKERALVDGGATIEWLVDDVTAGTGGWSTSTGTLPHMLEGMLAPSGSFGLSLAERPFTLDATWANARVAGKSLSFYLGQSRPLYSTALGTHSFSSYYNYINSADADLVPRALNADDQRYALKLIGGLLSPQSQYANQTLNHLAGAAPGLLAQMVHLLGYDTTVVATSQQRLGVVSQEAYADFSRVWDTYVQGAQVVPATPFYKKLTEPGSIVNSQYLGGQPQVVADIQNSFLDMTDTALRAAIVNRMAAYISSANPQFLAGNTTPPERMHIIYDSDRRLYIKEYGERFGNAEVATTIQLVPGMTAFKFHKMLKVFYSSGITGVTYTPPEVATPDPENLLADTLYLAEHHLYGSSRLGLLQYADSAYRMVYGAATAGDTLLNRRRDWYSLQYADWIKKDKGEAYTGTTYNVSLDTLGSLNILGQKQYELSDHLGNVLVTVLDKRTGTGNSGGNYTGWHANIASINDYYPFGMLMDTRNVSSSVSYRLGYNGKEKDDEIKGEGKAHDYEARIYGSSEVRWFSLDPLAAKYPGMSPYNYTANNPILFVDVDGKDWFVNSNTGDVVFVKAAQTITPEIKRHIGLNAKPSDYKWLGPNEMFGEKVMINNRNVLNYNYYVVARPVTFMNEQGYAQAEKVKVRETFTQEKTGSFPGDNFGSDNFDIEQTGRYGITYTKFSLLNLKTNKREYGDIMPFVRVYKIDYDITKPIGQDIRLTAIWPDNRIDPKSFGTEINITKAINEAGLNDAEAGRAAREHLKNNSKTGQSTVNEVIKQTKNVINRLMKAGAKKR